MAIGTITIKSKVVLNSRGAQIIYVSFAGDSDYHTGGTLAAEINAALKTALVAEVAAAGDKLVRGVQTPTIVGVKAGNCGQYMPVWATAGLKVLNGGSATRAEASNHGNLSTTTFNLGFVCT